MIDKSKEELKRDIDYLKIKIADLSIRRANLTKEINSARQKFNIEMEELVYRQNEYLKVKQLLIEILEEKLKD